MYDPDQIIVHMPVLQLVLDIFHEKIRNVHVVQMYDAMLSNKKHVKHELSKKYKFVPDIVSQFGLILSITDDKYD